MDNLSSPAPAPPLSSPTIDSITISPGSTFGVAKRTIIAIHGLGDTPENFGQLFEGHSLPATIVLVRAPTPHGRGGSWFPVAVPVRNTPPQLLKTDASRAAEKLCQFIRDSHFEPKPIVTGFSQGGILSFSMAVTCPNDIAAAVPIAGFLPLSIPQNTVLPPVTAFHGTEDNIVDYAAGVDSVRRLSSSHASAELVSFDGVGHTISDTMRQRWFEVLSEYL